MKSNLTPTVIDQKEFSDELPPGTPLLQGQYVIEAHLNSGGFGITYLAKDSLHRRVVIKECFPGAFCRRSKMIVGVRTRAHAKEFKTIVDLFVQEARQLARLRHPNIVGVHQVFLDNDTAYMALDYVQGRDLLDLLEDPSASLSPRIIQDIALKLLDAIEFIHGQGVLHRDISPDNILITRTMEPVLIDFGAARETATRATRHLGAMRTVKDGYSPQEFYLSDAAQHPSSDLYSLGASLYHLITGQTPPNAQERLAAVASGDPDLYVPIAERVDKDYSPAFLDAIDKALSVFPKHRIQSAAEWRAMITHGKVSSMTRGTVSRPMLAVDNGNVVAQIRSLVQNEQVATEQDLKAAGLISEPKRKMPVRKIRVNVDEEFADAQARNPVAGWPEDVQGQRQSAVARKKSSSALGLIAGGLLAAAAATFLTFGGTDSGVEDVASGPIGEPSAPLAPDPAIRSDDRVAAVPSAPEIEFRSPTDVRAAEERSVKTTDQTAALPSLSEPVDLTRRPPARPEVREAVARAPSVSIVAIPEAVPQAAPVIVTLPILAPEENGLEFAALGPVTSSRTPPATASAPQADPVPAAAELLPVPVESALERAATADAPPVMDVSSVISGHAVVFPFEVGPDDPTLIVSVVADAPDFLKPGFRLVSINGFPVESLADAQKIVKGTSDLRLGSEVEIALALADTRNGETIVRQLTLPTVQETFLLNGVRFRTQNVDGVWKTYVVEAADRSEDGLLPGDQVVALMPSSELIDQPTSLSGIIERELAAKVTKFNFAVNRGGDMYLVSMDYGGNN
jgi:serine/threonine protein kinase